MANFDKLLRLSVDYCESEKLRRAAVLSDPRICAFVSSGAPLGSHSEEPGSMKQGKINHWGIWPGKFL